MTIKPIETTYRGYRFRSRLEARWAVFFDAVALKWEYEPEGFVLPDKTWYLPDFRVVSPQGMVSWYEIKPPGTLACPKMKALGDSLESTYQDDPEGWNVANCQTLAGDPYSVIIESNTFRMCPRCGAIAQPMSYDGPSQWDSDINFGCWPCDIDTPSQGPVEQGLLVEVQPHKGWLIVRDVRFYTDNLLRACNAARSARFEHGESGAA